mgnify:CR=1 FL=1
MQSSRYNAADQKKACQKSDGSEFLCTEKVAAQQHEAVDMHREERPQNARHTVIDTVRRQRLQYMAVKHRMSQND